MKCVLGPDVKNVMEVAVCGELCCCSQHVLDINDLNG